MDKADVRKYFKGKKVSAETSLAAVENLRNIPEFQRARLVLAYYPLPDEIDITPLLKDSSKTFAFPVAEDSGMMHFSFPESTRKGRFSLTEPVGKPCNSFDKETVILMPAVAYDNAMRRIGRGGGYYDRFIADHPSLIKIGVVPSERIIDDIITEAYDAAADIIATEVSVLRIEAL